MKTKKSEINDERPSIETLRRGHRISPERHAMYSKALDEKYGLDRPRMGRPPKGAARYVPVSLRLPPEVLSWAKAKAKHLSIGYQTVLKDALLKISGNSL